MYAVKGTVNAKDTASLASEQPRGALPYGSGSYSRTPTCYTRRKDRGEISQTMYGSGGRGRTGWPGDCGRSSEIDRDLTRFREI